jgi:putative transposase
MPKSGPIVIADDDLDDQEMFKGHCFPKEIIFQAVYCKLRFSLSYRDIEALLSIRGIMVNHATIQRWVYKFTPWVEGTFRKKKLVGNSW